MEWLPRMHRPLVRLQSACLPSLFITVWMDRWMDAGCEDRRMMLHENGSGWAGSGCRIYLP